MVKTASYTVPVSFSCAIMYGDCSGLSDVDDKHLDDWIDAKVVEHGYFMAIMPDDVEQAEFAGTNDLNGLACDVITITFQVDRNAHKM